MRKSLWIVGVFFALLCLAAASPTFADTFTWSYSGGFDSGSGMLSASPTGTPGVDLITAMTGTFDGSSISLQPTFTCCSNAPNDNLLLLSPNPKFLDINGLAFMPSGASFYVNIYFCDPFLRCAVGSGYTVETAPIGNPFDGATVSSENGTFTVVPSVVGVPEPSSLMLLGSGLVGLLVRKRS